MLTAGKFTRSFFIKAAKFKRRFPRHDQLKSAKRDEQVLVVNGK